jgi:predicted transcriptional regulator
MSLTETTQFTSESSHRPSGEQVPTDDLLDLLSDDCTRELLGAIRTESKSARTLVEECGVSRPTVYRRLNRLQAVGLVTEQMAYDSDGHHRRTFTTAVETVGIELGDTGFEASLTIEDR